MLEAPACDEKLLGDAVIAIRTSMRSHVSAEFLKRRLAVSARVAGALVEALLSRGLLGPKGPAGHPVLGACALDGAPAAPTRHTAPLASRAPQNSAPVLTVPLQEVRVQSAAPLEQPSPLRDLPPRQNITAPSECRHAALSQAPAPVSPEAEVREVRLEELFLDPTVQPREALEEAKVTEYCERLAEGDHFPPVAVFQEGQLLRLVDGFHRIAAAERAGIGSVLARVQPGTHREAILKALRANLIHGLPLKAAEKRAAAGRLLADPDWTLWSDQEIARYCGLSGMSVGRIRAGMNVTNLNNVKGDARKYRARDGSVRTMTVSELGRKPARGLPKQEGEKAGRVTDELSEPAIIKASPEEMPPVVDLLLEAVEALLRVCDPAGECARAGPGVMKRLLRGLDALADLLNLELEQVPVSSARRHTRRTHGNES